MASGLKGLLSRHCAPQSPPASRLLSSDLTIAPWLPSPRCAVGLLATYPNRGGKRDSLPNCNEAPTYTSPRSFLWAEEIAFSVEMWAIKELVVSR